MALPARYILVTCQQGAESALKSEVARRHPDFRFSYSRPGFLTFKLPEGFELAPDADLKLAFARAWALSLGRLDGPCAEHLARSAWQLAADLPIARVHAWQRDADPGGELASEPGPTPLAELAREALVRNRPADSERTAPPLDARTQRGQAVLDCILVEPTEWWIGWHRAASVVSRWPGGFFPDPLPPYAVSRAYLKMSEALAWSRMPLVPGEKCVELGSAPGGAAQALLERGLIVYGVDPAEIDPAVLEHPNYHHLRKRAREVPRRALSGVHLLTADMNVAPGYTLDAVEDIARHPAIGVRRMLLTLKLVQWELADQLDEYLARIRSWGFRHVTARQLHHNRQEVCVAALVHRSIRRLLARPAPRRRGREEK